jgi:lysophospholipase L1-like esterase
MPRTFALSCPPPPRRASRLRCLVLLLLAALMPLGAVHAQTDVKPAQNRDTVLDRTIAPTPPMRLGPTVDPAFSAWRSDLAGFASADKLHRPDQGGVLFVGSSTIRLWRNLAQDFRQQPVINRGFGGSTLAACNFFAKELVVQYRPSQVLVYAGDNDLATGRTPQDVLDSFRRFTETVRGELPGARISFISIKPSPSRKALLLAIQQTNRLIKGYVATLENAEFIDTHSAMLTAKGDPRPELFQADMLHLNDAGYALWQSIISPHLGAKDGASSLAPAGVDKR